MGIQRLIRAVVYHTGLYIVWPTPPKMVFYIINHVHACSVYME